MIENLQIDTATIGTTADTRRAHRLGDRLPTVRAPRSERLTWRPELAIYMRERRLTARQVGDLLGFPRDRVRRYLGLKGSARAIPMPKEHFRRLVELTTTPDKLADELDRHRLI